MPKNPYLKTIILSIAFIILAIFVAYNPINSIDLTISKFVQQFHGPQLDMLMVVISSFGEVPVALLSLVLTALVFFIFKYKREAIFILFITGTGLVTFILKRLFARPRPTDEQVTLIESYHNNSFPSGHTLSYIVFFGFLILLMHRLTKIPKYIRQTIMGISYFMFIVGPLSRIYLGAHWFTDVVAGFLIGMIYLQVLKHFYVKDNGISSN